MVTSRTKIVATIGPRTRSAELIRELVDAGMNVARLNGAHADHAWHAGTIDLLRGVAPHVPIILDLPGPKVRTGTVEPAARFRTGDRLTFTTRDPAGDPTRIPVSTESLCESVTEGDVLTLEDGGISFTVVAVNGEDVVCRADCDGTLGSGKGIGLLRPERADVLSPRDREIIALARETGVDFVGVSFVSSAEHVERVRAVCGADGPRVIAKIECQGSLDRLGEIVEAADALLVDRGDLAVHTSLESLVISQKHILDVARRAAKPVIIATEMLHTMIEKPAPTKAEVCDISNAVLDGASAIMLSGETAIGKYPVEAVALMRRVADAAVEYGHERGETPTTHDRRTIPSAIAEALSLLCRQLPITKIVVITVAGFAARTAAACRPRQPILAVSNDARSARSFNLLWGTRGIHVDVPYSRSSTDHIAACLEVLWRDGTLADEDLVLVTSLGYPKSGNRMNMIQTHRIGDLRAALRWDERPAASAGLGAPPAGHAAEGEG